MLNRKCYFHYLSDNSHSGATFRGFCVNDITEIKAYGNHKFISYSNIYFLISNFKILLPYKNSYHKIKDMGKKSKPK